VGRAAGVGPLTAAALAAGSALPALVSGGGDTLLVDLKRPLEVRRAHLAGTAATLALHRVDAARLSADPAVQVANGAALPGPPVQFVATRFGLRATDGGQRQVTGLTPASLDVLDVLSRPASPQVLVRDPASPAGPPRWLPVFQAAGEIGATAPPSAGTVDAGAALASALAGAAALPVPPGKALDVTVLLQSGAPCRFTLSALVIGYRLLSGAFGGTPPGRQSVTLRLAPGAGSQTVPLAVPAGARVLAARVAATESFAPDRALSDPGDQAEGALPALGVRVVTGAAAAALVDPGQVVGTVSGAAVRVLSLADQVVATLEARADHAGVPTGRRLASGDLRLPMAGSAAWAEITEPALAGLAGRYWLVLSVRAGPVLWLAAPAPAIGAEGGPPAVLLLGPGETAWPLASARSGVIVQHRFTVRAASALPGGPVTPGPPPYRLDAVGGALTLPTADDHGVRVLDLGPVPGPPPSGSSAASAVTLRVTPLARGLLTLDRLHIEYEVDGLARAQPKRFRCPPSGRQHKQSALRRQGCELRVHDDRPATRDPSAGACCPASAPTALKFPELCPSLN
jgi:hypothetical protein